jgi:hypothetical protein
MKSFITFFREAYLAPTGTGSIDLSDRISKNNIPSAPATQKLNTSDQNAKDTPDLNLNQEKFGTYSTRYYMK